MGIYLNINYRKESTIINQINLVPICGNVDVKNVMLNRNNKDDYLFTFNYYWNDAVMSRNVVAVNYIKARLKFFRIHLSKPKLKHIPIKWDCNYLASVTVDFVFSKKEVNPRLRNAFRYVGMSRS